MDKTFIEFFAGIGLIHEALRPLKWRAVLANDNSPKKTKFYKANYSEVPVVEDDIRSLNSLELPPARLVTASFPCIDLSQAGNRMGINGQHSSIVWAFLEKVADLHQRGLPPEFLLLENVPGLLYLHEGKSIDMLLNRIAELGYAIDVVQVDARHFVPQARNRVFIIGVLGADRFERPRSIPDTNIRRYRVKETYTRNPHLPWVFFDFPKLPRRKMTLAEIIEPLPDEDARWSDKEQMEYFWSLLEHHHRDYLQAIVNDKKDALFSAVRRLRRRRLREQIFNLRFDGLASCLRTPKGGSSTQFVVEVKRGRVKVRKMLGVEYGRLQGVKIAHQPTDFKVEGSDNEIKYGFGDAVCVPVVRWVAEHSIEKVIAGEKPPVIQSAFNFDSLLLQTQGTG
ncbi:MAG: DNA (cytosine-5-)-methyltransferase [Pyrinomonadaceae bacterium]